MAARTGERASLLPNIDEWASMNLAVDAVKVASDADDCGGAAAQPPTLKPRHRRQRAARRRRKPTLREDVWTLLHYRASIRERTGLLRWSYAFEVGILLLITLNVALAMWFSSVKAGAPVGDDAIDPKSHWYDLFLYVSTLIFTAEYLLRLWACVEDERYPHPILGRLKWMTRPMSLIDLAVLVPFYLEIFIKSEGNPVGVSRGVITLRGLRLLRVMSFLRLERTYQAMKNLREIFALKRQELGVVTYLTLVLVLTSSTTIFFLENPVQPRVFSSMGVSAWWAVETITSLGYGDIVPVTPAGRLFSSLLALWGIILFTIPGAVLSSGFVEVMLKREQEEKRALEDALHLSYSRDSRSFSASTLVLNVPAGRSDSPMAAPAMSPVSRPLASARRLSRPPSLSLQRQQSVPVPPQSQMQERIEQLADMQLLLHERLDRQDAQLELILKLLQAPAAPRIVVTTPPFSAIVPPEGATTFD